jgi:hypothetical protein
VPAVDVRAQDLGVKLLGVAVVADEALLRVRHVEAAVERALEDGEDLGARRGALEAGVKDGHEGARPLVRRLDVVVLARVALDVAGVRRVELEVLERAAREEEARRVRGRVVGQPPGEAVAGQLVRVRGDDDDVARERGIRDLLMRGAGLGGGRVWGEKAVARVEFRVSERGFQAPIWGGRERAIQGASLGRD